MPVNPPPYPTDQQPKNTSIFPKGSYGWLKVQLRVANTLAPPDSDAFDRIDQVEVRDPDGNLIASWKTSDLDTGDSGDTYDENHVDYVGMEPIRVITDGVLNSTTTVTSATAAFSSNDVGKRMVGTGIPANTNIQSVTNSTTVVLTQAATATASGVSITIGTENVGFFAEGGTGATTGRLAQKILVPTNAEETHTSSTRNYTVQWRIKKNGVLVVDTENFDVGPAGVFVFSSSLVTVNEVKAGILTTLDDDQIVTLIEEATLWVRGMLEACGVDPDTFDELPSLVRMAIILYTRGLILDYDASSGAKFESIKEGTRAIKYAGQSSKDIEGFRTRADDAIDAYCRSVSSRRRVRLGVARQQPSDNPYGYGRVNDVGITLFLPELDGSDGSE